MVEGPRKPHWLKQAKWSELLDRYDGIPLCEDTGETDGLSVDHRVPRYDGGTDDIDNLCFRKLRLNIAKGIKPDKYWNQPFFFDQVPNLAKCRAGQRGLYNEIMAYADWFSQPSAEKARLLYVYAMVVGAGKTLAALMATCAYNAVMRAKWGAVRRADRLLILCKERSIRNQVARDIKRDVVKYEIFPPGTELRVGVVTRGGQLDDESWLGSYDVIVCCIQQLWDQNRNLVRLLHRFPVIVIDEPHYAFDQVNAIVEAATTSVCFGGTGSTIDGMGKLLDRMIKLYVYGYQDADENDRSMKYLTLHGWQQRHVVLAELDEAQLLDASGSVTTTTNTKVPGYDKNFEPAKSVVWKTVLHMESCDNIDPAFFRKAPHRQEYDCEVVVAYPVHTMISCDSVPFANLLMRNTNEALARQPKRFPREKGWYSEVVHCEGEEPDGRPRADKPLLPDHSWMRASQQPGYRLDGQCARIVFVVGMGREGVNNPLCGVVGVTSSSASQVEVVQRLIGRQIRSVVISDEGDWFVPPAELDTVTIVTHEVFADILPAIEHGIDFVLNMEAKMQALPTIDSIEAGTQLTERHDASPDLSIPFKDKITICGMVLSNPNLDDELIIATATHGNPGMERPVADFIEMVRTDPLRVADNLKIGRNRELKTYSTVLWEAIIQNPNDEQLSAFLRAKYPELARLKITDDLRLALLELFKKDASEVASATPPLLNMDGSIRDIDQVRKNIGGAIIRSLSAYYVKSREADDALWRFAGRAIKIVLGVPDDQSASKGSAWDTPNCLVMLERSEIYRDIQRYVISRLIEAGHCPSLKGLHS